MRENATKEELLRAFEIRREVQNVMGKYTLHFCIMEDYKLMKYWSEREDISLAVNDGYFVGQKAVASYYQGRYDEVRLASDLIAKRFPDKVKDIPEEKRFGIGQIAYRPIDTPVIEIAEDFQTAKGLWTCRGSFNRITPGGPVSYWDWSYLAADFILEGENFKIWHLQDLFEVNTEQGLNFTDTPADVPDDPAFAEMKNLPKPQPNYPETVRAMYAQSRPLTPPPRMPEPYRTFDETFSYGYTKE